MQAHAHTLELAEDRAGAIGALAEAVLIDEAMLSPKPGLVDARGSGAHRDLTLALMVASARSLRGGFAAMAEAGREATQIHQLLREQLGALGRAAEATMLRATGGVNTHRGAIWCLGLLAGAAGLLPDGAGAHAVASPSRPARASTQVSSSPAMIASSALTRAVGSASPRARLARSVGKPRCTTCGKPASACPRAPPT